MEINLKDAIMNLAKLLEVYPSMEYRRQGWGIGEYIYLTNGVWYVEDGSSSYDNDSMILSQFMKDDWEVHVESLNITAEYFHREVLLRNGGKGTICGINPRSEGYPILIVAEDHPDECIWVASNGQIHDGHTNGFDAIKILP